MFTSIISLCCGVWRVRRWRLHRRGVLEALRGVRIHWPVVSSVPFLAHRTHPQQHCTHGSSCNRVEESKWLSRHNITTQVADCHKKACVSSCAPGVVVELLNRSGYNSHELALASPPSSEGEEEKLPPSCEWAHLDIAGTAMYSKQRGCACHPHPRGNITATHFSVV